MRKTLCGILRAHDRSGTLSLALVDDREIQAVHRDFLGDDTPTDVISFRFDEGDRRCASFEASRAPFGELVISVERALDEARRRGLAPREELLRYAIHGLLHLLGHEDETQAGRRRMRRLERRYLDQFLPREAIQPPPKRTGPR